MATKYTCSSCPEWWTGTRTAHCSVCHRTFGGERGFTMHRKNFACVAPEALGLTQDAQGIWRMPAPRKSLKSRAQQQEGAV